jgi:hypothetical protein
MMAIGQNVRPDEAGQTLGAELARFGGTVEGLWMTTHRGVLTFWVLTCPIDFETQQRIYERTLVLYDRVPGIEFTVHILNPEWFTGGDALSALPSDAQQVALPTA